MFRKIVTFGAILAAASASLHGHGHAVSSQSIIRHDIHGHHHTHHGGYDSHYTGHGHHYDGHDTYAHPKYDYSYSVSDHHTGDHKSQHESRDGDVVHGYYKVAQPDGVLREVKYTAGHDGFNADVHYSGHSQHPQHYGHSHGHDHWY